VAAEQRLLSSLARTDDGGLPMQLRPNRSNIPSKKRKR
jgi:hypothetical protein